MNTPDRDHFDDLPILADLRDELKRRFTGSRGGASAGARRWARTAVRGAPIALAGLAAIAVAVFALAALRHAPAASPTTPAAPPHPSVKPPGQAGPSPAEQKLLAAAQHRVGARDGACVSHANRGATLIHGSPGAALLSTLGVLRRPAPVADRTYQTLIGGGFDIGAGVYVDYIRRARTAFGKAFYVIPEARTTPFSPIPARCHGEQRRALGRILRAVPAAERARVLAAQAQAIAFQRLQSAHRAGICFAAVTVKRVRPPLGVDMGCSPGVPPLPYGMDGWLGEDHRHGGALFAGIVRDGVATVTLHYPAAGGAPARTLSSTVVNNVAVFEVPPHTYHQDSPSGYEFRAAGGRIIDRSAGGVSTPGKGTSQPLSHG